MSKFINIDEIKEQLRTGSISLTYAIEAAKELGLGDVGIGEIVKFQSDLTVSSMAAVPNIDLDDVDDVDDDEEDEDDEGDDYEADEDEDDEDEEGDYEDDDDEEEDDDGDDDEE